MAPLLPQLRRGAALAPRPSVEGARGIGRNLEPFGDTWVRRYVEISADRRDPRI